MHEYALAQDLVKRAVGEALRQEGTRVLALHIRLGPEGLTNGETLAFGVRAACQGTVAEGADVCIVAEPQGGVVLEAIELEEVPPCA